MCKLISLQKFTKNGNLCNYLHQKQINQLLGTLEHTSDQKNTLECIIDENSQEFLERIVDEDNMIQNFSMDGNAFDSISYNIREHFTSHQNETNRMNGQRTGQLLHYCYVCNKGFALSSNLSNHISLHAKENNFELKSCSMHFSQLNDCKNHEIKQVCKSSQIHKPKLSAMKQNNLMHKCSMCAKNFHSKIGLRYHINGIHTKEISYKCMFCPKIYYYRSTLYSHQKKCKSNANASM